MVANNWSVLWKGEHEPFGTVNVTTNAIGNDFRFPGQFADGESGLYYNWNRFYQPGSGRYLTPDPVGIAGGMNVYGYVQNDPVNWGDPEGLAYSLAEQKAYGNFRNSYEGYSECVWECLYKNYPTLVSALAALGGPGANLKSPKDLKRALKQKGSPFTSVDKKHPKLPFANPNGGVKRPAGKIQRLKPVGTSGTAAAVIGSFAIGYIIGAVGNCMTECEQCPQ